MEIGNWSHVKVRYLPHIWAKDVNLANDKNVSLLEKKKRLLNLNEIPNALGKITHQVVTWKEW